MRKVLCLGACLLAACLSASSQTAPSNVVSACVGTFTGIPRLVSSSRDCIKGLETFRQWDITGAQGPAGPQGIAGPQGPGGLPGAVGPQGSAGPQGATGAAGTQGPTGATGATGAAGSPGIAFAGPYSTDQQYTSSAAVLYDGALYLDTYTAGPVNGIVPTNTTYWTLLLPAGATGAKGDTGAPGSQGLPGVAGPSGPTGPTGATGPTGPAGGEIYSANLALPTNTTSTPVPNTDAYIGPVTGVANAQTFIPTNTQAAELVVPAACSAQNFTATSLGTSGTSTASVALLAWSNFSGSLSGVKVALVCTLTGTANGSPASCSAAGSAKIAAGQPLTISVSPKYANNFSAARVLVRFTCQ